jgi:hypothetical protein
MTSSRRAFRCLLASCLLALAAGCPKKEKAEDKPPEGGGGSGGGEQRKVDLETPRPAEVSGTIKLADGKPLPAGWIAFHGRDPADTVRVPVDQGKFKAQGVPSGDKVLVTVDVTSVEVRMQVLVERVMEAMQRASLMKQAGKDASELNKRVDQMKGELARLGQMHKALKAIRVDSKYAQPEKTTLSAKIAPGAQTIELSLAP